MKFILMMHAPRASGDWDVAKWSADDQQAMFGFMKALNEGLNEEGVFVSGEGLSPPGEARVVRASQGGEGPEVTDGPYAESKEFLAGYWIVDVETPEQAYAIAARASVAPGPGGKPMYLKIEVRQVMSAPPVEP